MKRISIIVITILLTIVGIYALYSQNKITGATTTARIVKKTQYSIVIDAWCLEGHANGHQTKKYLGRYAVESTNLPKSMALIVYSCEKPAIN